MNGMDIIKLIQTEKADPPSGIRTLGLDGTHRWITHLSPGRCDFSWPIDERHLNLESAVICSWTIAVADQVLFFAGMTLCGENEVTRMAGLHFQSIADITDGPVSVEGTIDAHEGNRLHATCRFVRPDGRLAALVTSQIDIVRT